MCDPVTLTVAATAVAVAGQGVSAYAGYQQGKYESKVATVNSQLENEKARDALLRGQEEGRRFRGQVGRQVGSQRASMASNGLDLGFGNAADVVGDTVTIGAEDSATIRQNSFREARGYEISAMNYRGEAGAAKSRAVGSLIEGAFGMASTALGGATQYSKLKPGRR